MTMRVVISGDKWSGFTWQLVDRGKVLQSGEADTQAKAVVAGQDAQIEYIRSRPRDRWWERPKTKSIDKPNTRNDT